MTLSLLKKTTVSCPYWEEEKTECLMRAGGVFIPLPSYKIMYCSSGHYCRCAYYLVGTGAVANNERSHSAEEDVKKIAVNKKRNNFQPSCVSMEL